MTCKGICVGYRAQKPGRAGRYANGQKRCQVCEIFIKWDGLWCPCCRFRLRTRPRNTKYKERINVQESESALLQYIMNSMQTSKRLQIR
jgi:hypothetical protein